MTNLVIQDNCINNNHPTYCISAFLSVIHNQAVLQDYAEGVLKDILEYDRIHHSRYAPFLKEYVSCDSSVLAVAEKFRCHRNTVNAKIKSAKELFGLELNAEEKLGLLLAFSILSMRDNSE